MLEPLFVDHIFGPSYFQINWRMTGDRPSSLFVRISAALQLYCDYRRSGECNNTTWIYEYGVLFCAVFLSLDALVLQRPSNGHGNELSRTCGDAVSHMVTRRWRWRVLIATVSSSARHKNAAFCCVLLCFFMM